MHLSQTIVWADVQARVERTLLSAAFDFDFDLGSPQSLEAADLCAALSNSRAVIAPKINPPTCAR